MIDTPSGEKIYQLSLELNRTHAEKLALEAQLADLQDNFKQVNQANSILLDEVKQLRGGSRDDIIWHQYFCAFINNAATKKPLNDLEAAANDALELYKQRWSKDDNSNR